MGRRPKTDRVPKTRACGEWTEAAFWGFVRSNIRVMSRRWPPIRKAKELARRKYEGPNKRQKWEYCCAICGGWFPEKEIQVDHVEECGSLKSYEDISGFVQRLLCEVDGLRVLCKKKCHRAVTDKQRGSRSSV